MRHLIIGNSAAAMGAIEAIRATDRNSEIVVIADEPHHVYSRPLITYWLGGAVDEPHMYYRPEGFYVDHSVTTMLGTRVDQIRPSDHAVLLHDGSTVTYDRLLIATGGKPFVPNVQGSESDGVFVFTTWEDGQRIARYIDDRQARSAVVIGGGMIGIKTTEALLQRGVGVTIVELAPHVLSTALDATASALAEEALDRAGVRVLCSSTVKQIASQDGRAHAVVLRGAETIPCDLVVFAIGVRPNTDMIPNDSGIQIGRGICVDAQMRTSAPDVFAAGDCTESIDLLTGIGRNIATWPNAVRQGWVAGRSMAGQLDAYTGGLAMNSIDVCGLSTIAVGLTNPQPSDGCESLERIDRNTPSYRKLVIRDDRLVGAVFVGDVDRAGIYTGLIREGTPITRFRDQLLAGSFGLIALPKDYRKMLLDGEPIEP